MSKLPKTITLTIADESVDNIRLDKFISEKLELFSRSQIPQHNLEVLVNEKLAKMSRKVSDGDRLRITYTSPDEVSFAPEKMDLEIIYEDENAIVVNKKQGVVVHPAAGNYTGTLVQGLLYHSKEMGESFDGEPIRPGIVHRLDKDTSGVIIAAKHPRAQEFLSSQFRKRRTQKKYYALVKGNIPYREETIETLIVRDKKNRKRFTVSEHEGRRAETIYRIINSWDRYSFAALMPITGRTHQLRVHMKSLNHPIIGDVIYARKDNALPDVTLMLHAYSLAIRLPDSDELRTFRAPLPKHFKDLLNLLNDL
ncbi:MAG: RluA family pseudouridine synthase [Spirochaetales bacterium]|nr:RluA family pseudouridine synthase [Spirochaetales bacterium]